jgi:hypothetical protein
MGDSFFQNFLVLTIAILFILQDGPDRMAEEAKLFKYPFPYLYDEVWLQ